MKTYFLNKQDLPMCISLEKGDACSHARDLFHLFQIDFTAVKITTPFERLCFIICRTRLALTSVLGPFGNSFYPPRVRIPFQSQVQMAIQIPIQIPVRQSRVQFMFTQVIERPW